MLSHAGCRRRPEVRRGVPPATPPRAAMRGGSAGGFVSKQQRRQPAPAQQLAAAAVDSMARRRWLRARHCPAGPGFEASRLAAHYLHLGARCACRVPRGRAVPCPALRCPAAPRFHKFLSRASRREAREASCATVGPDRGPCGAMSLSEASVYRPNYWLLPGGSVGQG